MDGVKKSYAKKYYEKNKEKILTQHRINEEKKKQKRIENTRNKYYSLTENNRILFIEHLLNLYPCLTRDLLDDLYEQELEEIGTCLNTSPY